MLCFHCRGRAVTKVVRTSGPIPCIINFAINMIQLAKNSEGTCPRLSLTNAFDEIQVTVIYRRTILVAVTSECC